MDVIIAFLALMTVHYLIQETLLSEKGLIFTCCHGYAYFLRPFPAAPERVKAAASSHFLQDMLGKTSIAKTGNAVTSPPATLKADSMKLRSTYTKQSWTEN